MRPTVAISLVLAQAACAFAYSASAQDLRGMATAEAIGVLDEVCGKTIPDFSNAEAKARALGFAFNEQDPVKDLSIEVKKSTSGVPMCEVNFGTNEQIPEIIKRLQLDFDVDPDLDPYSFRPKSKMDRMFRFEDEGYRDTDHVSIAHISQERKSGRFYVSLLLWGKK